jgi:outer membrane lipoprotein-sorting protein
MKIKNKEYVKKKIANAIISLARALGQTEEALNEKIDLQGKDIDLLDEALKETNNNIVDLHLSDVKQIERLDALEKELEKLRKSELISKSEALTIIKNYHIDMEAIKSLENDLKTYQKLLTESKFLRPLHKKLDYDTPERDLIMNQKNECRNKIRELKHKY